MNGEVFELVEADSRQVILKVHAQDSLVCARHPYVDSDMDLITVTRGEDHTLTVFDRKGRRTNAFDWGVHGRTMVDESMSSLRRHAEEFIRSRGILLDSRSDKCTGARMYWNSGYEAWQLACDTAAGRTNFWFGGSHDEQGFRQAKKEIRELFPGIKGFEQGTAPTGITVWKAKLGRHGLYAAPAETARRGMAPAVQDADLERACAAFREAAGSADMPAGCRIEVEAVRFKDGSASIRAALSDPMESFYLKGQAPSCEAAFKPERGGTLSAGDAFAAFAGMLEEGRGSAASMPRGLRSVMADASRRAAAGCAAEEDEACGMRP